MSYYHQKFGRPRAKRQKSVLHRFIIFFLFFLLLSGLGAGYLLYSIIYRPNVWTPGEAEISIFIPSDSNFDQVKQILYNQGLIVHRNNFEWLAERKSYPNNIKGGRYIISHGMSNDELINLLRSGKQTPVRLTFNNIRDIYQLAGRVSQQIEADSASLINLLTDSAYISYLGFNHMTLPALFIPNTYEFYWTTNPEAFVSRMFQEYQKFWDQSRKDKANEAGLSEIEVSVLASIIDRETNMNDEKATMAGVYINRLRSGWRLQADPTLVFAVGDFEIRRVLDVHKTIESPFNTYKHGGLPPGPICLPSIASIDAVLNYEKHRYFFFCARDDMSGYHAFAETNLQHQRNARAYRQALDRLNIKR
jgi:UPF0755 protein